MEVYKTPSAAIVMLMREVCGKKQILLQRRRNTGFADGLWDFSCSGKVEEGETMTQTAVREAQEELGVGIAADGLEFALLIHKCDRPCNVVYYNAYFTCSRFDGEPHIRESEKCSEIEWFFIDGLPDGLMDDRRQALKSFLNGERYLEYGWED